MKKYLQLRKYTFKNIDEHPRASLVLDGLAYLQRVHVLAYKRLHHEYATHSTVSKPRVKCPGVDPRYANAPPSGLVTIRNAPLRPAVAPGGGGGWALLELTDALRSYLLFMCPT